MKIGVQNNVASEARRICFWFVPPIVTFQGYIITLVANEVNFFKCICLGDKTAVWGAIAPRALSWLRHCSSVCHFSSSTTSFSGSYRNRAPAAAVLSDVSRCCSDIWRESWSRWSVDMMCRSTARRRSTITALNLLTRSNQQQKWSY